MAKKNCHGRCNQSFWTLIIQFRVETNGGLWEHGYEFGVT